MNSLLDFFYLSIFTAALVLCAMGLSLTSIIPGIDHWSKRFFQSYFAVFMLCCLSSLIESIAIYSQTPRAAIYFILALESLLLVLPLPMLTVYLLHCCGENIRQSRLFHAVIGIFIVYFILIIVATFTTSFIYVGPDNHYSRNTLYPLALVPPLVILLLNLICTLRRRKQLSLKTFLSFLIAILPMTATLFLQLFFDVFPLMDISYVLSALSMYSLVLSDQIERDRQQQREIAEQQREIAEQQREIAEQQREIAHERASIMVLQMRPHFIYNTLMSIYSLCNIDPQKARQVTMDFTNYLRKNFNAVASDSTIPFSAELEHTRAYLAVEQTQFEEMLVVDYDTQFIHFRLPPLTLQPLVENAVKHGMDPYSGPLHVSIRTRYTESVIEIIVEDNGPGFDPSDDSKPHTTLTNIQQRLEMMCDGRMVIEPRDGRGTVVKITIPSVQPSDQ